MSLRSAHCTVCRLFRYRPPTPAPAPPLLYRRCTAAVAHVLHQGDMYGEDAACPIRPEQMTSEVCCGGGGGGCGGGAVGVVRRSEVGDECVLLLLLSP